MKRSALTIALLGACIPLCSQTIITSDYYAAANNGPKIRFAIQAGLGHMIGTVDKSKGEYFVDYQKKVKNGRSYGAELTYFMSSGYGLGVKYSNFYSSQSVEAVFTSDEYGILIGTLSDQVDITFIGPYYSISTASSGNRNVFGMNAGVGYVGYKDNAYVAITPFQLSGWTLGYYLSLQYDRMVSDRIAVGAEVSGITGTISSITRIEDGTETELKLDKDNLQSVMHLTATIGVRIYL